MALIYFGGPLSVRNLVVMANGWCAVVVIAGFFTGASLAVRGGWKSARNSGIGCAIFLAVIEGVNIGFQRMMAENTRLDVWFRRLLSVHDCILN